MSDMFGNIAHRYIASNRVKCSGALRLVCAVNWPERSRERRRLARFTTAARTKSLRSADKGRDVPGLIAVANDAFVHVDSA